MRIAQRYQAAHLHRQEPFAHCCNGDVTVTGQRSCIGVIPSSITELVTVDAAVWIRRRDARQRRLFSQESHPPAYSLMTVGRGV